MTTPPKRRMLRRSSSERLTELARGIVRREYLIVDDSPEWKISLSMVAEGIVNVRNLGAILVPVAPHMRGYWINDTAPGVTLTCTLVAKGDLPELQKRVDAMHAALYPDETKADEPSE